MKQKGEQPVLSLLLVMAINLVLIYLSLTDMSSYTFDYVFPAINSINNIHTQSLMEYGSISRNPYLELANRSLPSLWDGFSELLSTDELAQSRLSVIEEAKLQRSDTSQLQIVMISPVADQLTQSAILQWSVRGTELSIPNSLSETSCLSRGITSQQRQELLKRQLSLDVRINNNRLNIPNSQNITITLNDMTLEMNVDLATYHLQEGAHEIRVSILLFGPQLENSLTASSTFVFYYHPQVINRASPTKPIKKTVQEEVSSSTVAAQQRKPVVTKGSISVPINGNGKPSNIPVEKDSSISSDKISSDKTSVASLVNHIKQQQQSQSQPVLPKQEPSVKNPTAMISVNETPSDIEFSTIDKIAGVATVTPKKSTTNIAPETATAELVDIKLKESSKQTAPTANTAGRLPSISYTYKNYYRPPEEFRYHELSLNSESYVISLPSIKNRQSQPQQQQQQQQNPSKQKLPSIIP